MIQEIKSDYQDHCYICSKLVWYPSEAVEADVPRGGKVLICSGHTYAELKRKLESEKSERD